MIEKQKQLAKLIIQNRYARDRNLTTFRHHNNQQDGSQDDNVLSKQGQQQRAKIQKIIKDKYLIFTKWDLRKSLPQSPRSRKHLKQEKKKSQNQVDMQQSLLRTNFSLLVNKSKQDKQKNQRPFNKRKNIKKLQQIVNTNKSHDNKQRKSPSLLTNRKKSPSPQENHHYHHVSAEMTAVKSDRRQRFIKLKNPMQFVKHYIQKQNYKPSEQQKQLVQKFISVQSMLEHDPIHLEIIIKKIYNLMNLAVDYNQLIFLSLLVLLAGDICFFMKDFPRAFYFYNQARIAGTYAHLDPLKVSSLIGMAKIAHELQQFQKSSRLFKKALQYAWRANDQDKQLQIYDWLGQTLHAEGKSKFSIYYHTRFSQSEVQQTNSALKKISNEMLQDYDTHILSLEDSNLNSLFIEYLNLPIGLEYEIKKKSNRQFVNYTNGSSPRMKKKLEHSFNKQDFLDAYTQLQSFLENDPQFRQEIPDPDDHQNYASTKKFGRMRKQLDFEHSIQFNKILGFKQQKVDVQNVLKLPLDVQVQKKLQDRLDPLWYQKMVQEIKKKRSQKVGTLKQRVRKSHLSYHKYPSQRRKSSLWNHEQINYSFNRTLLDWIDPKTH